jgi:hypothetical protein
LIEGIRKNDRRRYYMQRATLFTLGMFLALVIARTSASARGEYAPVGPLDECTPGGAPLHWGTVNGEYGCYVELTSSNSTITLDATATCTENAQVIGGSQYAYALECKNAYGLLAHAWAENDEYIDDCNDLDTIGLVTVQAQPSLAGKVLETTYSGEECPDATPFESAPGVFAAAPC